jgi:hypothetical protein
MKATLDVLNEMVELEVIGPYAIAGAIAAHDLETKWRDFNP